LRAQHRLNPRARKRQRLCPVRVIGVALVLFVASTASAELEARLDKALGLRALRGARVAALVVSREDGSVLYARDADRALVPASNLKVLTALAALSAFGPAHRFTTEVLADAPPDAEGAIDVLALRGGGDPALTSEQFWRLAADLRLAGVSRVRKELVLDASAFDRERWHPTWGRTTARAYHAPVGALTANYGAFAVSVRAGARPGDPVRVTIDPPVQFLSVTNRARTGSRRSKLTLVVDRAPAGAVENVVVTGSLPAGRDPEVHYRSVLDPVRYAGAVLAMQLEAVGIALEGPTRVGPAAAKVPLIEYRGQTLAEIVRLFLKYSNNAIAEGLVKSLGARAGGVGTWTGGIAAVREELAEHGVPDAGLRMVDGSGLSTENRVSPRTLVAALRAADQSFGIGPEFEAALPIAAADGTLRKRSRGAAGRVRAKTGLLTGVTGLSGYAARPDGTQVVFSILVNGFRDGADGAMAAVDRFAAELTTSKE